MNKAIMYFTKISIMIMAISSGSVFAGLIGNNIGLQGYNPDTTTLAEDFGSAIVSDILEFPAGGFSTHNIDLTDTTITFEGTRNYSGIFTNPEFVGFRLYDVDGLLGDILSVSLSSGIGYVGSNALAVTFDTDNIFVNFAGLAFTPDSTATYDVEVASVPEPSLIALMGAGLVGLGLARRKVRK